MVCGLPTALFPRAVTAPVRRNSARTQKTPPHDDMRGELHSEHGASVPRSCVFSGPEPGCPSRFSVQSHRPPGATDHGQLPAARLLEADKHRPSFVLSVKLYQKNEVGITLARLVLQTNLMFCVISHVFEIIVKTPVIIMSFQWQMSYYVFRALRQFSVSRIINNASLHKIITKLAIKWM